MAPDRVRIGTRGSRLALRQSELVADLLRRAHPHIRVELQIIQTKGDLILDRALSRIGDKGLFVTEIESALIDGQIDLAVHSCKDLPSETPAGLALAAFPPRADVRDALVSRHGLGLDRLPRGARIGTSSLRRACQLRARRPDLEVVDLRGNVDTRLRKVLAGDYDAIVLAAAGLARLDLAGAITELLEPEVMLPAVAQGALAVECRADVPEIIELIGVLDDRPTRCEVEAERAFLARLQGGCQVPLAANATATSELHIRGLVGTADGVHVLQGERRGATAAAAEIGAALAEDLLCRGADTLLQRLSESLPAAEAPRPAITEAS